MQKLVIKKIDDDFVECIVNLVHGNFTYATKEPFLPYKDILEYLVKNHESLNRKKQRKLLASSKGLKLLKTMIPHIYEKFSRRRRVGRI